jgi:hypothetical protein
MASLMPGSHLVSVRCLKMCLRRIFKTFWPDAVSNKSTVDACGIETSGSANQPAEMEVDWTYTEEGFLCHRKSSFQLEPQGQCRAERLRSWSRLI